VTSIDTIVYFWLALTIICVVVEALTLGLTSIWFAFGGLAALVAGILGAALWLQIVCFIVVTIVMLVLTRPLAVKFLKPGLKKTNVDAIPGKMGEVIEEILPMEGKGQVKLEGQVWSAKVEDGKTAIPVGTVVTVIRVEGVKVVVRS
jgi:membrane protein implicated in regulation of membrane protease activity